ncbi:ribonuclease [Bacteriophage Eos]|nr:ribonuclease [Bacteriophage Eos]
MSKSWGQMKAEADEKLASRKNLMIVDGTNLGFRFKKDIVKPIASSFLNTINSLANSYDAKDTIILGDKGKSIFRTEIYPEYKGNRDERFSQRTEEEVAADKLFFEYLEEAFDLASSTYPTFKIRGVEADDMAGFIIQLIGGEYDHVWLISTDGDWDTLLSPTVSRFSFTTRREYHERDMYENHQCDTVEQFASLKALMGDMGDNIRGVEGLGPKRGYGLLREYGTALDILDALPLPGKQKFIQNLNASAELIERNLQLVDLPTFCGEAIAAAGQDVYNKFKEDILKVAHK